MIAVFSTAEASKVIPLLKQHFERKIQFAKDSGHLHDFAGTFQILRIFLNQKSLSSPETSVIFVTTDPLERMNFKKIGKYECSPNIGSRSQQTSCAPNPSTKMVQNWLPRNFLGENSISWFLVHK